LNKISAFDWDQGNLAKCQMHGVTIEEIEALFRGDPRVAPDVAHPDGEDRFVAVGRTAEGRPLFVAFTLREAEDKQLIRPVSARYMHRKEIERYE
jgi:uncharacterized DUF497 family protein